MRAIGAYKLVISFVYSYRRLFRLRRKLLRLLKREGGGLGADYFARPDIGAGLFTYFEQAWTSHPFYEREAVERLRGLSREGKCLLIDVGAYVGMYSIMAAKVGCEVLAFEPNPISALFLRRNVEGARLGSRVLVVEKGLWDSERSLTLRVMHGLSTFIRRSKTWGASEEESPEVPVEVTTLDKVYEENRHMFEGKRVLMKIDVEGAGLRVVRGGLKLIEETRPHVVFEVHRFGASGGEDDELTAIPYFLRLGYRWKLIEDRGSRANFVLALTPP